MLVDSITLELEISVERAVHPYWEYGRVEMGSNSNALLYE